MIRYRTLHDPRDAREQPSRGKNGINHKHSFSSSESRGKIENGRGGMIISRAIGTPP